MVTFSKLKLEEITVDFLDHFERFEVVKKAWRIIDGEKKLSDVHYVEEWDQESLRHKSNLLMKTIKEDGFVFVAMDEGFVIAFAALENKPFGSRGHMVQLSELHVSQTHRGQGIGKYLFKLCAEQAKRGGAESLYISASSSANTQSFYRGIGCQDAVEVNGTLASLEPFDVQMTFDLTLVSLT